MSVHGGHRQRLKERFLKQGLDGFTEVQMLELLLFYAIPQKDTNPLAHLLIDRFGSLAKVMEAPPETLMQVDGIKDHAATLIKITQAMCRAYDVSKRGKVEFVETISDCGDYLKPYFVNRRYEMVYILCLDSKLKVLDCLMVGEGSINSANVPVRRVVETALNTGATSVVLAHNHPSGFAMPSAEDVQTTRRIAAALSAVEITLVDHIIFGDNGDELDYITLVQSGYNFDDCQIY